MLFSTIQIEIFISLVHIFEIIMVIPLCKYFGKCGGCSLQHIDYSLQLENKRKALANAVKYDDINIKVFSGKEYYYRNRMDMIFHQNGLGFREKDCWYKIVDVEKCVISNEGLNLLLKEVRDFFKIVDCFDVKKHTGTFRYAVIRTPKNDSSISFVLNDGSVRLSDAVEKIKEFTKATTAKNVIVTYVPSNTDISISDDFFVVKGTDMLKEEYLSKTFWYSVQGFFQNNPEMAEKMISYSKDLLKKYDTKRSHLLDLYGGVGTFGIINSELFEGVTIVENDKNCISAANKNIVENDIKNAKAVILDAKQLKKLNLPKPLLVITDPPRSGMHPKTIQQLNELKPEAIIYVSCNINQLGKDIPKFKNYTVKSVALFDLFPQTLHSEAVVELILSGKPKNI